MQQAMREKYDVMISGGGFAGSVCGAILSQAGASVLLVEAEDRLQKRKPCGGALHPNTLETIKNLLDPDALPAFRIPDKARYSYGGCTLVRKNSIAVCDRKALDDCLLSVAVQSGAEVLDCAVLTEADSEGHQVKIFDKRAKKAYTIRCDRLIAADGAVSTLRRCLTGRNQAVVLALAAFSPSSWEEMIFQYLNLESVGCGYAWHFPTLSGANLGIGIFGGQADRSTLDELLTDFVKRLGIPMSRPRAAWIPCAADILLSHDEVLFIGDAAGLVNPVHGGGLHYALASAEAAAEAVIGAGNAPVETTRLYRGAMEETVAEIKNIHAGFGWHYFKLFVGIMRSAKKNLG